MKKIIGKISDKTIKKTALCIAGIVGASMMLTGCGNEQSKVNQVLQNQMNSAPLDQGLSDDNQGGQVSNTDGQVSDNQAASNTEGQDNQADTGSYVVAGSERASAVDVSYDNIDVDLTTLSSTMVYSEVYNMVTTPENYEGKVVKMNGIFGIMTGEINNQIYCACVINDATACCAQGIEFTRSGGYVYPEEYPELGSEIVVTGVLETYEEYGYTYIRLMDAVLEK